MYPDEWSDVCIDILVLGRVLTPRPFFPRSIVEFGVTEIVRHIQDKS